MHGRGVLGSGTIGEMSVVKWMGGVVYPVACWAWCPSGSVVVVDGVGVVWEFSVVVVGDRFGGVSIHEGG